MRHLLPLVFVLVLICTACARRSEDRPAPEPVPVVVAELAPVVAPRLAPLLPVPAPGPLAVAPEPLPVAPGRTNGIGKRVVIDGLAVWVEAVEYKPVAIQLETGELRSRSRRLVISFGLQSADPAQTFDYTTWARYNTMMVRDARGRSCGCDGADGPTHTGNVTGAAVTSNKPVFDELMFSGYARPNPSGSAEPFAPDFTAYFDIDLPRPTLPVIDLPRPMLPFDESRMYRFRVRAPEVK